MTKNTSFPLILVYVLSFALCGIAQAHEKHVSTSDRHIMNQLAAGSVAEIRFGKMITQRSTEPSVKSFAERMVTDHGALLAQAQTWAKRHSVRLDLTPPSDDAKAMATAQPLTGRDLDQRYIDDMLAAHKKDVAEVARFIDKHPHSAVLPEVKNALTVMEDHLRLAENVAGQIGVSADAGLTHASTRASG